MIHYLVVFMHDLEVGKQQKNGSDSLHVFCDSYGLKNNDV